MIHDGHLPSKHPSCSVRNSERQRRINSQLHCRKLAQRGEKRLNPLPPLLDGMVSVCGAPCISLSHKVLQGTGKLRTCLLLVLFEVCLGRLDHADHLPWDTHRYGAPSTFSIKDSPCTRINLGFPKGKGKPGTRIDQNQDQTCHLAREGIQSLLQVESI